MRLFWQFSNIVLWAFYQTLFHCDVSTDFCYSLPKIEFRLTRATLREWSSWPSLQKLHQIHVFEKMRSVRHITNFPGWASRGNLEYWRVLIKGIYGALWSREKALLKIPSRRRKPLERKRQFEEFFRLPSSSAASLLTSMTITTVMESCLALNGGFFFI